jgi:GTP-binding protein HflX
VLGDLDVDAPSLLVLNKMDRVDPERRAELRARFPQALLVSAHEAGDVERVRAAIVDAMQAQMAEAQLHVPYTRGEVLGQVHAHAHVVDEAYRDDGVALTVRAPPAVLARLRRALEA